MWKNQRRVKPCDSCKGRERKQFPEKCNGAAAKGSRWWAHRVCASWALTWTKALQKMFCLNLFSNQSRILCLQGAPFLRRPPSVFFLLCLEKGWKVPGIDHSSNILYGNICSFQGLPWELKVRRTSLDEPLLLPLVIIIKGRGRNNTATSFQPWGLCVMGEQGFYRALGSAFFEALVDRNTC